MYSEGGKVCSGDYLTDDEQLNKYKHYLMINEIKVIVMIGYYEFLNFAILLISFACAMGSEKKMTRGYDDGS